MTDNSKESAPPDAQPTPSYGDTVPRSRYDACNADWLAAKDELKRVQTIAAEEITRLESALAQKEAELAAAKQELNVRRGDPVTRLHNLCAALEEDKNDSPYSAESWDQLETENAELRKRAEQAEQRLAAVESLLREWLNYEGDDMDGPEHFEWLDSFEKRVRSALTTQEGKS